MTNPFLPASYELPTQNGNYMKFKQGDNNFRVLSSAIIGWIDWDNKKPIRTKEKQEQIGENPPKHFWAFVVLDLDDNEVEILEVTQSTIQTAILALVKNEKWGDPKGYDLTVTRTGEDLLTKYTVVPSPHTKLDKEVEKTYKEMEINLEALYDGANPFEKKAGKPEEVEEVPHF